MIIVTLVKLQPYTQWSVVAFRRLLVRTGSMLYVNSKLTVNLVPVSVAQVMFVAEFVRSAERSVSVLDVRDHFAVEQLKHHVVLLPVDAEQQPRGVTGTYLH